MKVIVIDKTGGPEVLQYKDSSKAQVEAGQILVKNPAIGNCLGHVSTISIPIIAKASIQFLLSSLLEPEVFAKRYIKDESTYAYLTLERQLVEYINNNNASMQSFDIHNVSKIPKAQEEEKRRRNNSLITTPQNTKHPYHSRFTWSSFTYIVSSYGQHSGKPIELTESETEYVFHCKNTRNDQFLEEVVMMMQPGIDDCGLEQFVSISSAKLEYNVTGVLYLAFHKLTADFPIATFTNTLKFVVKDCHPTTGEPDEEGYEDEYQVEDFDVLTGDYIQLTYICNFAEVWEQLGKTEAL
ncbi:hypothetical protein INT44_008431 [Umbelopsis vinacea]|uniref:Coatomer gamma subunit appendage Ig-like subdomain domain-containing protein n=1 Tax=Umbelopsis vinacea TaxID=44442 RepID=A0A8H7PWX8_9FUNG|nr:hypothetical protein INT44_008431 [Umbelopsis vinacea]